MLRQAGVDDRSTAVVALILMGCFTALGMIVMLGRLEAAAPTAGFGLELDAISAARQRRDLPTRAVTRTLTPSSTHGGARTVTRASLLTGMPEEDA